MATITARRRGSRTRSRTIAGGFMGSVGWTRPGVGDAPPDGFTLSITDDNDTDTFHVRLTADEARRAIEQWTDGLKQTGK